MRKIVFSSLLLIFVLLIVLNFISSSVTIVFSEENHFLTEDTVIFLSTESKGNIYYTLDGTAPTRSSYLYEDGIKLVSTEETTLYTIRARVIRGSEESEVFTTSYFIGENVYERFDTIVFVLSSEYDGLFGYERGILVPGRRRADWEKFNPDIDVHWDAPANFHFRGRESERRAFVEVFEPNGTRIVAQHLNMRVSGNESRHRSPKSIKLFARTEQGQEVVQFPFFESRKSINGDVIEEYYKLQLRLGQDLRKAFLRDVLAHDLALNSGQILASNSRPAAVYINSDYYMYANMTELLEERFFASYFNTSRDDFEIVNERSGFRFRVRHGSRGAVNDLERIFEPVFAHNQNTVELISEEYDIESLLFKLSFIMYSNNFDFLGDFTRWRNINPNEDNRWQHALKDYDHAFKFTQDPKNPEADVTNFMLVMMGLDTNTWWFESVVLIALLRIEQTKNQFLNNLLDQMNYHLSPEAINESLTRKYNESRNEIYYFINSKQNDYFRNNGTFTEEIFERNIQEIRDFANVRPQMVKEMLFDVFGLENMYSLTIRRTDANIRLNSIQFNGIRGMESDFKGSYFGEIAVPLSFEDSSHRFDRWIINGIEYFDKEILITSDMIVNGNIVIEVKTK